MAFHNFKLKGDLTWSDGTTFDVNGFYADILGLMNVTSGASIDLLSSTPGGVIEVDSTNFNGRFFAFDVTFGAGLLVRSGDGVSGFGFHDMLGHAGSLAVDGTLDLNGMGSVALGNVSGSGKISDTGAGTTIFGTGFDFHGLLTGAENFIFIGVNDLSGATFNLAPDETLGFAGASEATVDLEFVHAKGGGFLGIDMSSNGTSQIVISNDFKGTVNGFGAGDEMRLPFISGDSASTSYIAGPDPSKGGLLQVSDADGHHVDIFIQGGPPGGGVYTPGSFSLSPDGHGGTLVDFQSSGGIAPTADFLV